MRNWQIIAWVLCGVLVVGAGCSSDSKDAANNNTGDVEQSDVGGSDVDQGDSGQVDSEQDVSPDVDTDDSGADLDAGDGDDRDVESDVVEGDDADAASDVDEGEVVAQPVTIETGGKQFPFRQAAYGFTSPENSEDGVWEVYVELWDGGFTGCPIESSPTPRRQLVFFGMYLDADEGLVFQEKLSLVLLDFKDEVFEPIPNNPFFRAFSIAPMGESWEFCTDCLTGAGAEGRKNGDLVVSLEAEFENGTVAGTFRAKHCASMDVL